jgi:hypothetical protein
MKTDLTSVKSIAIARGDAFLGGGKGTASSRETAMKTGLTVLESLARSAQTHGLGTLLVGALCVIFYLAGHGGMYEVLRSV